MLAAIACLTLIVAPTIRTVGPLVMVTLDPSTPNQAVAIADLGGGLLAIQINDATYFVPGNWVENVVYVDASSLPLGSTCEVVNESLVPLFVSGGAGVIDVSCGFAGNTIYCGIGDAVVHGRSANLAFVVGHPKATSVTFFVEQASSSVLLVYVNDSRTKYRTIGRVTAKWER